MKLAGKVNEPLRAADGHNFVLNRLAQHFQDARPELGQFIQEQHPAMREGDLTGLRPVAPADQSSMADGVMRRTEGARPNQGHVRGKGIRHRVDAGHIQGFVDRHGRQDAGHGARQQGLACPGRSDHQHVMPARGRDLEWRV